VLVQRKINLVPLEQEAGLNLCPAPRELPTVNTPAGKLGVLICLDGFYHELIDQHAKRGVRVIAMPSYNPLPWTKEEAQGWETGLLAGVQKHPDMIGVNPMGVGAFSMCGRRGSRQSWRNAPARPTAAATSPVLKAKTRRKSCFTLGRQCACFFQVAVNGVSAHLPQPLDKTPCQCGILMASMTRGGAVR
jgi:hypothetical protein